MKLSLISTQHERDLTAQKLNTTSQQLEILKNDKMYLSKEVESLTTRANRAEDQVR
jgi:hypothetical protein